MNAESTHMHEENYLKYQGKFKGLLGWIFSTDHKRIGLLYLYSIAAFFILGAILGLMMKLELIAPGKTIMGGSNLQWNFYTPWYYHDIPDSDTGNSGGFLGIFCFP
jgi:hypothetical protein